MNFTVGESSYPSSSTSSSESDDEISTWDNLEAISKAIDEEEKVIYHAIINNNMILAQLLELSSKRGDYAPEERMAEEEQQNEINPEMPAAGEPQNQTAGSASNPVGRGSKTEWPELVGFTPEEAEARIKADMPTVQIQVVPFDHFVTMDYKQRRVRLFLDSNGRVARPPRIG